MIFIQKYIWTMSEIGLINLEFDGEDLLGFKKEFEKDLKRNLTIQELKMHKEVAHLSFISEIWKILKGMHEKIKNNHDKMPSFFYYYNEQNENLLEKSELKKMKIIY